MTDLTPTLTISIDRTLVAKDPLVFSAVDGDGALGVMSFQAPGRIPRHLSISPVYTHSDVSLGWSFQQGLLRWETFPDVASEAAAKALYLDIIEACTQWPSYAVTVTEGEASADVWTCKPGSVEPAARTRANMVDHDTVWSIALPCYPVPS